MIFSKAKQEISPFEDPDSKRYPVPSDPFQIQSRMADFPTNLVKFTDSIQILHSTEVSFMDSGLSDPFQIQSRMADFPKISGQV